jgi:membrane protein YqaA with SNARE-associated domain
VRLQLGAYLLLLNSWMNFLHHLSDALLRFGPWGVLLLSGLDSVGIPVPTGVDILLVYVAWKSPDRAWITASLALLGSVAGNCGLFWASRGGLRRFVRPPAPGRPRKFHTWFHRYGLVTVFIPALLPIPLPLKIFVISAGILHTPFSHFFLVVLVARTLRFFGEAWLGVRLGRNAQAFLGQNAAPLIGVAVGLAVLLFLLIHFNDRRRRRPPDATIPR